MNARLLLATATVAVAFAPLSVARAQGGEHYHVTATHVLGGDGGWDYVIMEPNRHRLFIGRQDRIMVVDPKSGKLLGEVTGINGAHGVAVVEKTGHGFATSGRDSSIVM